jgi:hypothetical protein
MAAHDEARSWRSYAYLTGLVLTILATATYTHVRGTRLMRLHAPMARAASEIKAQATLSHLWLEEILSGDPRQEVEEVWVRLAHVDREVLFLLDATRSGSAHRELAKGPAGEDLRAIQATVAQLKEATHARLSDPKGSQPGSDIDEHYDGVFASFLGATQAFESSVHHLMRSDLSAFRKAQLLLVAGGLLLLALGFALFHRHERDRLRHLREIKAAKEELELRVEQRTLALRSANRSLAEAKEAAELASRVKDEFLEHMSDDLMTPLNVVLGYTDLLLDRVEGALSEEQQRSLQKVRRSGGRLQECLENILELSSMVSKPPAAGTSLFNPALVVERAISSVETAAARREVQLRAEVEPGVPETLEGDPERLWKALSLLLEDVLCGAAGDLVLFLALAPNPPESLPGDVFLVFSFRGGGVQACAPATADPGLPLDGCLHRPGPDPTASLRLTVARHLAHSIGGELFFGRDPGQDNLQLVVGFRRPEPASTRP